MQANASTAPVHVQCFWILPDDQVAEIKVERYKSHFEEYGWFSMRIQEGFGLMVLLVESAVWRNHLLVGILILIPIWTWIHVFSQLILSLTNQEIITARSSGSDELIYYQYQIWDILHTWY